MLQSKEDIQIMKLAIRIEKRRQAIKFCAILVTVMLVTAVGANLVVSRQEEKVAAMKEQASDQDEMNTLNASIIAAQKELIEKQTEVAQQLSQHNMVYVEPRVSLPKPKVKHKATPVKRQVKRLKRKDVVPSPPKEEVQSNSVTFKTPQSEPVKAITPVVPAHVVSQPKCSKNLTQLDAKTCYDSVHDKFSKAQ